MTDDLTILLVDDEEDFTNLVKLYFKEIAQNMHLETVTSPIDALQLLKSKEYDVVVSDYQMPPINGLEFLKRLRDQDNDIPFILFTGRGREEVIIDALNLGADFYLQKGGEWKVILTELKHFILTIAQRVDEKRKRQSIEEALRRSEKRFRELVELLPQTVFELDLEGNVIFANRFGFDSFGYSPKDLEDGLIASQLFIPEDRERSMRNIARIMRGEQHEDHEYTGLRKDGSTFPVLVYSNPIIHNDKPTGLRGIVLDVTNIKKAEEALMESELQYRKTLDSMADPIHVVDAELRIILMNAALKKWSFQLGLETDLIGKKIFDAFPFLLKSVKDEFQQIIDTMKPLVTEEQYVFPGIEQSITTETRKIPIIENNKVVRIITVIRDITERKMAEDAIYKSKAQLRQIIDLVPHFIFAKDRNGRFFLANKTCAASHGLTPEEMEGKSHSELVGALPEEYDRFIQSDREVIDSKKATIIAEEKYTHHDGRVVVLETCKTPFTASGVPAVLGVSIDITKRKNAERKASRLNAILQAICNANYLLLEEKDRDKLLKGICDTLVETIDFCYAWILLIDKEGNFVTAVETGLNDDFLPLLESLKDNHFPECCQKALNEPGVDIIRDLSSSCSDCPLNLISCNNSCGSVRIEYKGRIFGVITISIPDIPVEEKELFFFQKIADDIAPVLFRLEIEETRKQVEMSLSEGIRRLLSF